VRESDGEEGEEGGGGYGPGVGRGDGGCMSRTHLYPSLPLSLAQPDFSIPNGVCNQLRRSLKKGSIAKGTGGVPRGGMESRARRTQEGVLDQRTRLILFKMINKGTLFREVGGVVKTGKESYVFYAPGVGAGGGRDGGRGDGRREGEEGEGRDEVEREGGRGGEEETEGLSEAPLVSPSSASSSFSSSAREGGREGGREGCDCAIKVFKTTLNEFSNRSLYIDGDPRFGKMLFNKVQKEGREGGTEGEKGTREGRRGIMKHSSIRCQDTKRTLLTFLLPFHVPSLAPPSLPSPLPPSFPPSFPPSLSPAILSRQIPALGRKRSAKPPTHAQGRHPLPRALTAEGARPGHVLPRRRWLALPPTPRG